MSKIAEHRKSAGMTQQQLGDALKVSATAVAHWERERREPSLKTLRKIAEALGVKVQKLIE